MRRLPKERLRSAIAEPEDEPTARQHEREEARQIADQVRHNTGSGIDPRDVPRFRRTPASHRGETGT